VSKRLSRQEPTFISTGPSAESSRGGAPRRSRRIAHVTTRRGWAAVWLSAPAASSQPVGFYGFRNFDVFATLIVELQAEIQG
jgi:hypothetical protein